MIKAFLKAQWAARVSLFTLGRSAPRRAIENCLRAGGGMKQVDGDVADSHARTNSSSRLPVLYTP